MWYISLFPVFDSEAFSFVFGYFDKSLLKIWEHSISVGHHIDDREDDFISLGESEELLIDLRASAYEGFLDFLILKIIIERIYRVYHCESFERKIPPC
jgi:hypothetical protein